MKKNGPYHLVINSMPQRRGGGLTIMTGLVDAFAKQNEVDLKISVVCSADETRENFESQAVADQVLQPLKNASPLKRFLWANLSFGKYVTDLKPDMFFAFNQYTPKIPCPQIVFHTNLLHFMPIAAGLPWKRRLADRARNRASKAALQKADVNVFESEYLRECGEAISKRPGVDNPVIYHGLPDELASATPDESPEPFTDGLIVSITNQNPHKDNTTLLQTLAELVRTRPDVDWRLKIAGGIFPELWQPYKDLATELGVRDRVEWLGFFDQDQLTGLLKTAMCLISTSRVESFCLVGIEAMARGCPAVVAKCAAMPESIEDAGILVEPGDSRAFAESIVSIRDRPDLRKTIVDRGFQRIRRLNWKTCGQQFGNVFRQVVDE